MDTFPAAPERQVTLANWRTAPFSSWAFHHVRELIPSADIDIAPDRVRPLEIAPADLTGLQIDGPEGPATFEQALAETCTDGLVVLKDRRIAFERYANGMTDRTPHICMSVSKSLLGMLAGILAERGALDVTAPATLYVPELKGTAFEATTIRHLLDMRTGVLFDEDYLATSGPIIEYRKAQGWNPTPPGEPPSDLRSFLLSLMKTCAPHGGATHYVSPCTDLMAWILERATGQRYADLLSAHLWQPLGAATPSYITVDRLGAPRAAGGVCVTTRDLARVGQMIADGGAGIVPGNWIEDIFENGDADAWTAGDLAPHLPGVPLHYRSKCYVLRGSSPSLMALGVHGQYLFVDPSSNIVVAKHGSRPAPLDAANDVLHIRLFDAIRRHLG